ncbi:Formate/nitrite transporter [Pseudovirgaria hyperparasitica]|uniref:Formate/nitrite transporter n=1 Tax=Pseudovirgaria hyperparasitica TaxID=470096 RepID=A0A6A6W2S0_9PEZI|nr:Formate/nitrite transporter [Pseudovirgaria hyperparasitica]KAF2756314.1 Formate/nitrite transporter [Pseudovirgaria hyperparasitica]
MEALYATKREMRLLKAVNDRFELTSFPSDRTPSYAILSHTWGRGEDDEVIFSDISDGITSCLTGADLCTGSFLFTTVAVLQKRLSPVKMLLHWFITFWGNLAGALFVVSIIFGYGNVFAKDPYLTEIHNFVRTKQVVPMWHNIFLRGIGCNWLVCLGCFFGFQARDLASKIIGIWFPIFAFVALGFDHVVANMFFVPMGIWLKTPGVTVSLYIWKGIIPAFLGNLVGGALFCGGYYWWMYLAFQPEVEVDGVKYQRGPVSNGISLFSKTKGSDVESNAGSTIKKVDHAL